MMTLYDFLKATKNAPVRPRVVCTDGFSISIQASACHYCSPRKDGLMHYYAFELRYPSEFEPLIDEFAEEQGKPDTVFEWVPEDIVKAVLKKHGGIDRLGWK